VSATRRSAWTAVLVLGATLFAAAAAEIVIPPSPSRWATDKAGFLTPSVLSALDARLQAFSDREKHQVLVYIDKTTGGDPIEDFAVKAFEAWKVGRKGLDDGLVLFIMSVDRKIRIEVGYGLEDKVTDARSSQVINNILVPKIQAGDQDAAVSEAVNALLGYITGVPSGEADVAPARPAAAGLRSKAQIPPVVPIVGGFLFLVLLVTHPRLAFIILRLLFYMSLGGSGRGGGGGGGGFSGGGGRSGGGGASGGW
jgi:uncharacterized protein